MKSKYKLIIFVLMATVQLAIPAQMIIKKEVVLAEGHQVKFLTEPVDPYDPFRGKYVQISISETKIPLDNNSNYKRGQKVYALITEEGNGFSKITGISDKKPGTNLYFETKVLYDAEFSENSKNNRYVHIKIPFDRYYMDENLAPRAESEYAKKSLRVNNSAYITVRLKSGYAALERLYVDGIAIEDYLLAD